MSTSDFWLDAERRDARIAQWNAICSQTMRKMGSKKRTGEKVGREQYQAEYKREVKIKQHRSRKGKAQ